MVNGLALSLKLKLGNGEERSNLSHPFTNSSFDYGRHLSSKRRVGGNFFLLNSIDRHPFGFSLQDEGPSSQQRPNTALNLGNPGWNMNPRLSGLNQYPNALAPKLDLPAVNRKRVAAKREAVIEGGEKKKKFRLSEDQCTVLEQTFAKRTNLNSNEKRNLAKQLVLKPRQVQVWFQNKRARTKLKQNAVDHELKYFKEVQELRSQRFKDGYLADDDQESQPESSVSAGQFF